MTPRQFTIVARTALKYGGLASRLSMLSIALGLASLLGVTGLTRGVSEKISQRAPEERTLLVRPRQQGRSRTTRELVWLDAMILKEGLPTATVIPIKRSSASASVPGHRARASAVMATSDYFEAFGFAISQYAPSTQTSDAIIGDALALDLGIKNDQQLFLLDDRLCRAVGLMTLPQPGGTASNLREVVRPWPPFVVPSAPLSEIAVAPGTLPIDNAALASSIITLLAANGGDAGASIAVTTATSGGAELSVAAGSREVALTLAAACLFAGVLGVCGSLILGMRERAVEIGLRRALGASRARLEAELLLEVCILTFVGALLGVPAGWAAARFVCWRMALPTCSIADVACIGVLGVVVAGCVFGLWPARAASRRDPAAALRS